MQKEHWQSWCQGVLIRKLHGSGRFASINNTHWDTVRAPVFGRHQFFGTLEYCGKAHGSLLSGWMSYNYTARCWFPTSRNISILPSQFWQIRFESCWLHCSKCRILVLLRYMYKVGTENDHEETAVFHTCMVASMPAISRNVQNVV